MVFRTQGSFNSLEEGLVPSVPFPLLGRIPSLHQGLGVHQFLPGVSAYKGLPGTPPLPTETTHPASGTKVQGPQMCHGKNMSCDSTHQKSGDGGASKPSQPPDNCKCMIQSISVWSKCKFSSSGIYLFIFVLQLSTA